MLANIEILKNEKLDNYVILNRDSGATAVARYSTASAMIRIFPGIVISFPDNKERAAYIKECKRNIK